MDAKPKAYVILRLLCAQLQDATVTHRWHQGACEFVVRYWGHRFMFRFPEQALLRRGMQEIEQVAAQIVERIRLNSKAGPTVSSAQLG